MKLTILFLGAILVLSTATVKAQTFTDESISVRALKTSSEQEYFNNLVEYKVTLSADPSSPDIHPIFKKHYEVKGIKGYNLSFANGNLQNEELFTLPEKYPRFGSFLVGDCENEKDFIKAGHLGGNFFSLANHKITEYERYTQKFYPNIFWYSYNIEHLCVEHLYKLKKFFPDYKGYHQVIFDQMLSQPYSAISIEYIRPTSPKEPILFKIRVLMQVANNLLKRLLDKEFVSTTDKFKFEYLDHYLMTNVTKMISGSSEPFNFYTFYKGFKRAEKASFELKPQSYEVIRALEGPIGKFSNVVVHRLTNRKKTQSLFEVVLLMDSHQYAFLSDVQFEGCEQKDLTYLDRIKKPVGVNPITSLGITVSVKPESSCVIRVPYLINMRIMSENEQEYERGTYILGSVAFVKEENSSGKPNLIKLTPILTNEKQIDQTFAFTTLTLNNIALFIIPIMVMFFGMHTQ